MTATIRNVMICWTGTHECLADMPTAGKVALIPWPDRARRSDAYFSASGACDLEVQSFTRLERQHYVLSTALRLVMTEGIAPAEVHRALWPLKEYRDGMPVDTAPPARAIA